MDLGLNEDQQLLRETTEGFLSRSSSSDAVRDLLETELGCDPSRWRESAQLGWASFLVDEAHGGCRADSAGVEDLVIIAEELGRQVQPSPLLPVNVVADAIQTMGSDEQQRRFLPALVNGDAVATWCFMEPGLRIEPHALRMTSQLDKGTWILSGSKRLVQDASWATEFLVTAEGPRGLSQFLVPRTAPGVEVRHTPGVDLGRRFYDVEFRDVQVVGDRLIGREGAGENALERQLQLAIAMQCAETVGLVDRMFDMTLEYSRSRFAFGRSIGSYQAIKHRFADLFCELEASKAVATAAAKAVQSHSSDASVRVSVAKAYISDVSRTFVSECQQIFGGIGMTWEHDLHLYFRRVISNAGMFGTSIEHRERLARLVAG